MSVKSDLEEFVSQNTTIDHLVYGDLSAGMVFFATSATPKGQEAHDGLIQNAAKALSPEAQALASLAGSGEDLCLAMSSEEGTFIFARAAAAPEEGIALSVSAQSAIVSVSAQTLALLNKFASAED